MSGGRQDWRTPKPVFDKLNEEFGPFDLDAAADDTNHLCWRYYTEHTDGLTQPWVGRTFVNVPFGDPARWVDKAIRETVSGRAHTVTMIVCANISARWFHAAWHHANLLIPDRRITYWHPTENPGSFDRDSAIFVFSGWAGIGPKAHPWACPEHVSDNRRRWAEANGQGTLFSEAG